MVLCLVFAYVPCPLRVELLFVSDPWRFLSCMRFLRAPYGSSFSGSFWVLIFWFLLILLWCGDLFFWLFSGAVVNSLVRFFGFFRSNDIFVPSCCCFTVVWICKLYLIRCDADTQALFVSEDVVAFEGSGVVVYLLLR